MGNQAVTATGEPSSAPVRRATLPPDLVPEDWRLGRYVVRFKVAQGGMGAVYLAQLETQAGFRKWVALKTIDERLAKDRNFVRMFLAEARLTAKIDHPNVCTVFDFGEEKGTYFLAMEYLAGESLSTLTKRASAGHGVPVAVAAKIIADAARGLHAAHELKLDDGSPANVVHRDVSPQNIFVLYDGVAKVVDFGVAFVGEGPDRAGFLAGKRPYMSPEQLKLNPIDRRSDIWSLGVVLWEATTGQRLFRRESDEATEEAILNEAIPGPRVYHAGYPRELEAIVMKALARKPEDRFQTAAELARAIEQYLALSGEAVGVDEVRAVMHEYFGARMAAREMQIRARSQDAFGGLPDEDATHAPGPGTMRVDVAAPRLGRNEKAPPTALRNAIGWIFTAMLVVGLVAGAGYFVWTMPAATPPPRIDPRVIPLAEAGFAGPTTVPSADAGPVVVPVSNVSVRPRPLNAGFITVTGGGAGGLVFEGGTLLGAMPLNRYPLAPGRHLIRVEPSPGAAIRTLVVNVQTGRETTHRFPSSR
ncbi:MAG: serine/threonine protein kinase [Myxococcales bacterium]|nr:serine/threonine protein kinase [Myxococcales bacterium]